jgi:hypothetical protein
MEDEIIVVMMRVRTRQVGWKKRSWKARKIHRAVMELPVRFFDLPTKNLELAHAGSVEHEP